MTPSKSVPLKVTCISNKGCENILKVGEIYGVFAKRRSGAGWKIKVALLAKKVGGMYWCARELFAPIRSDQKGIGSHKEHKTIICRARCTNNVELEDIFTFGRIYDVYGKERSNGRGAIIIKVNDDEGRAQWITMRRFSMIENVP